MTIVAVAEISPSRLPVQSAGALGVGGSRVPASAIWIGGMTAEVNRTPSLSATSGNVFWPYWTFAASTFARTVEPPGPISAAKPASWSSRWTSSISAWAASTAVACSFGVSDGTTSPEGAAATPDGGGPDWPPGAGAGPLGAGAAWLHDASTRATMASADRTRPRDLIRLTLSETVSPRVDQDDTQP